MKPIVFGGRFGWLHPGKSKHGVVLCSPFGHEHSRGHKAMRYLAEELSAHDLAVLRFDFLATGVIQLASTAKVISSTASSRISVPLSSA